MGTNHANEDRTIHAGTPLLDYAPRNRSRSKDRTTVPARSILRPPRFPNVVYNVVRSTRNGAAWLMLCLAGGFLPLVSLADEPESGWLPPLASDQDGAQDPFADDVDPLANADQPEFPAVPDEPFSQDAYQPHSLGADTQRRMQAPFAPRRPDPTASWTWEILPPDLLYKSYLAGPKEPRLGAVWVYNPDGGWFWDVTLGARLGLWRWGTHGPRPEGWQLDVEGAVFPRLNFEQQWDLESADFRFGLPLTWSSGPMQMKIGYYHMSSHVGDEFLERNPGFQRTNFVRDGIVVGYGIFPAPDVRLYSEVGIAFHRSGGADPFEFQFGAEYSPVMGRPSGTPFAAANVQLFEEQNFGGSLNVQAGWQWRNQGARLFRLGLQYFNGKTSQYSFYRDSEELLGAGIWVDF